MKCSHSAFNAQGSRLMIVVVHSYEQSKKNVAAAMEALKEKGKTG